MPLTCLFASLIFGLSVHAWDPAKDLERMGDDVKQGLDHLGGEVEKETKKAVSRQFKPRAMNHELRPDQVPGEDTFWIGVVGDSSVTGAVASPSFHVTKERVGDLIGALIANAGPEARMRAQYSDFDSPERFGVEPDVPELTRVMFAPPEFKAYEDRHELHLLEARVKGSRAVDTSELAYPYLVGRALGVPAPQIVLAAQDGAKIERLGAQLDRLFVPGAKTLPPLVLISFVANDLCDPDVLAKPADEFAERYGRGLKTQLDYALTLPAHRRGTKLVFVAPLKIGEVLSNPDLLNQTVEFENGRNVSCRQIHDGSGVHGDIAKKFQDVLIGACRGILKPDADPHAHRRQIDQIQARQIEVLERAVDDFNQRARDKNMSALFATSIRDLPVRAGDLAADCFHPGARGHAAEAETLLEHELKPWRQPALTSVLTNSTGL